MPAVEQGSAWNTAVSFVTNTNWQGYSGESTMGHLVQMAGLAVQNFVSAAVGIAVAIALVRGFARTPHRPAGQLLGRPDPRTVTRVLLPLSVVGALVLVLGGVVQNLRRHPTRTRWPAATQFLPGGPVASPGGHQGARHQRRRLLQRQLRAPVRGPDGLGLAARGLPAPGHPVRAAAHVRPDGRRQAAGLRDPRRHGALWPRSSLALTELVPGAAPRHRDASWPGRRWRARRSASGGRRRRCSPTRPR